jgi:hypothetical protein
MKGLKSIAIELHAVESSWEATKLACKKKLLEEHGRSTSMPKLEPCDIYVRNEQEGNFEYDQQKQLWMRWSRSKGALEVVNKDTGSGQEKKR